MDFGPSAQDYARHRRGFPDRLFEEHPLSGRVLDLGSGTGSVALGYARRGARVVATDLSPRMLRAFAQPVPRAAARAEALPVRSGAFDAVTAGQCWHWFDGPAAAREALRVLRPGGTLLIAHFDYLAVPGSAAASTEEVLYRHKPDWAWGGSDGLYERWRPHLAGFEDLRSSWSDVDVPYSHEDWRGRIRACNALLALPDDAARAAADAELAQVLAERHPGTLQIAHRLFVLTAAKPD